MADLVEDLLALHGKGADAGGARQPRLGDVALEAVQVELQGLQLEFRRGRLEAVRVDGELGDQAGGGLVAARGGRPRMAQGDAEGLRGLAAPGRGGRVPRLAPPPAGATPPRARRAG